MLTECNLVGARPAGACTCDRAAAENAKPAGSTCACGARPAGKSTAIPFHRRPTTTRSDACQMLVAARKPPTAVSFRPRPISPPRPLVLRGVSDLTTGAARCVALRRRMVIPLDDMAYGLAS